MKPATLFICTLAAVCGVFSETALAQTTTASTSEGVGIVETVLGGVNEIKETVEEQLQPVTTPGAVLDTRTQTRITNLAANISNRFEAISNRLQNIINRLNSRIEKLQATGVDTSAARTALAASQTSLSEARTQLNSIDKAVQEMTGSPNPKEAWSVVKMKFINTRDSIRNAHAQLRTAIKILKEAETAPITNEIN